MGTYLSEDRGAEQGCCSNEQVSRQIEGSLRLPLVATDCRQQDSADETGMKVIALFKPLHGTPKPLRLSSWPGSPISAPPAAGPRRAPRRSSPMSRSSG
jgi:hypothetical protein